MNGDSLSKLPQLRKILRTEELAGVHAAAAQDGHGLLYPTHMVLKENQVVGAFSIGGCPMVTMWLSGEMRPRESLGVINAVENIFCGGDVTRGAVLVEASSPFHGLMESMGYRKQGVMTVFVKEV